MKTHQRSSWGKWLDILDMYVFYETKLDTLKMDGVMHCAKIPMSPYSQDLSYSEKKIQYFANYSCLFSLSQKGENMFSPLV